MRKAAEIDGIVEAVAAGVESLVATGCHDKGIPRGEGLRQLELFATEVMPEFGIDVPAPA